jgi:hypothetical protein
MTNMSDVIKPKSDQLNAEDFLAGERTFTIRLVEIDLSKEQPVSVFLEGEARPFKPSKSMSRIMTHFWGEEQAAYHGRMLTLFRDDSVTWAGEKVGGIRISHMSHLQSSQPVKLLLAANKKQRKAFTITPIADAPKPTPQPAADDLHIVDARAAAMLGTDHFRVWWTDNAGKRASAKTIMWELQKTCADADSAVDEDPFGLPPSDARNANEMTDAELAQQAEQDAAEAEFATQNAAEMAAE